MFFSRKQPSAQQVAAMQAPARAANAAPPVKAPERGVLGAQFTDTMTLAVNELITDLKSMPDGKYWRFEEHGIPAMFAESFAVVASNSDFAVLVVANDAFSSHPQFDLQRRLREAGLSKLSLQRATREILRAYHTVNAENSEATKQDSSTQKAAWDMLNSAVEMGASDVHIQTRTKFAQIYFRIHGERVEQPNISMETAMAMANVMYTVHGDADSKGVAWDPKTVAGTSLDHVTSDGVRVQVRFSSRPIHPSGNFKAVLRLLVMDEKRAKPIEEIGLSTTQTEEIEEMLVGSQGMVLVVGPTNSGKSTLLQAMVRRVYDRRGPTISVDTLEQPVEYIMEHACQTAVPEGRAALEDKITGSIFTTFLKGFLQQDPDVLVIGEIRSRESAAAVAEAVLAGRKLLTTLHAYDPFAVFARLLELGVPPSVLFMPGFVSGVVYQRLVRELCPHCAIALEEGYERGLIRKAVYDRVLRVSNAERDQVKVKGDGCSHCNGTGIIGRTACAAVVRPTVEMLTRLAAGDELGARQVWHAQEHLNIDGLGVMPVAHAISKMRAGRLDPTDIERQLGTLVADTDLPRPVGGYRATGSASSLPPSLR